MAPMLKVEEEEETEEEETEVEGGGGGGRGFMPRPLPPFPPLFREALLLLLLMPMLAPTPLPPKPLAPSPEAPPLLLAMPRRRPPPPMLLPALTALPGLVLLVPLRLLEVPEEPALAPLWDTELPLAERVMGSPMVMGGVPEEALSRALEEKVRSPRGFARREAGKRLSGPPIRDWVLLPPPPSPTPPPATPLPLQEEEAEEEEEEDTWEMGERAGCLGTPNSPPNSPASPRGASKG